MLYIKLLRPLGDRGNRGGGMFAGRSNIKKNVVALGVWSSVGTSVWLGHQYHLFTLLNKAKNNNPNQV